MKIKRVYIKSFGSLNEYSLEFTDGVNLIRKENECGKTTVAEFIKAMLYGINSGVRSIRNNPRKKYMPWGKASMGGELIVEHNGMTYLIIRSFGIHKNEDKVSVINDVTGECVDKFCTDMPCFEMTGVGVEAFDKALYLNHFSVDMEGKNGEITDRLAGLIQSGDESLSYKRGCEILDNAIKEIESPRNGNIKLESDRLNTLHNELRSEEQKEEQFHAVAMQLQKLREEEEGLQAHSNILQKSFYIICAVSIVASVLLAFVSMWLTAAGIIATVGYAIKTMVDRKKSDTYNIEKRLEISKKIGECEGLLKERESVNTLTIETKIEKCNKVIEEYTRKLGKLKLAKACLDDAFAKLQQGFGTDMNRYVSEILGVVTHGKYDGVKVDKSFEITVHCEDGWQSANFLSDGAYSQIYFSLKMAIVKMLFDDMPLILDDAFALYDENRLKRAMEYLSNTDGQVILFSSR